MRERSLVASLAVTAAGLVAVLVLLVLGLYGAALWVAIGTMTAQNLVPLIRRTGRAASPPAQTEIRRTTRGTEDG